MDSLLILLEKEGESRSEIYAEIESRLARSEEKEKIQLIKKIGEYYYNLEQLDSAEFYFDKGIEISDPNRMDDLSAFFYLRMGMIHNTRASYQDALQYLQTAKEKILKSGDYELQSDIYRITGNIYYGMGIYEKALNNYLISLEIADRHELIRNIASSTNNIGNIYQAISDFDNARSYYRKAYDIARKEGYKWIAAISANNIGDLMNMQENHDSSIHYLTISYNILDELGSKFYKGIILYNIGEIYLKIDSIDLSRDYLRESLELANISEDRLGVVNSLLKLGETYLKENRLSRAKDFIDRGMQKAQEIGSFIPLEYAYELKTEYFTRAGLMDSAFISQGSQLELKDSINRQGSGKAIARLENQYKEEQTALEIESLKKDKRNSQILFIVIFSAISIILIIIIYFLYSTRRKNIILAEKNLEIEVQQKLLKQRNEELTASQEELEKMNEGKDQFLTILSHDLRNPITGIRGFVELMIKQYDAISDDKKKIFLQEVFDSVEKLSLLLTNVLLWVRSETRGFKSHPKLVDLSKRIDTTLSLYTLMAKSKDITFENRIPPDVMIYVDLNHFDTIIRNLISNSLKFTDKKGYIRFEASSDQKRVQLKISDTGIGMTKEKIKKVMQIHENTSTSGTGKEQGTGLGLNLIQNFVSLMKGEFNIESTPGKGSTFTLILPSPTPS